VQHVALGDEKPPAVYYSRAFHTLVAADDSSS
jgi:hypothetical protein